MVLDLNWNSKHEFRDPVDMAKGRHNKILHIFFLSLHNIHISEKKKLSFLVPINFIIQPPLLIWHSKTVKVFGTFHIWYQQNMLMKHDIALLKKLVLIKKIIFSIFTQSRSIMIRIQKLGGDEKVLPLFLLFSPASSYLQS